MLYFQRKEGLNSRLGRREEKEKSMKAMVIYCTKTGSTEKIAKRIAKDFNCPQLKVEADVVYGGFFSACARVVSDRLQKTLPKAVTETPEVSDCDILFLGFPIWWDDMPDYFREFLGRLDADGKRLVPFATSGRSDMSRAIETLRELFPNANICNPFHYGVFHRDNYLVWKDEVDEDAAMENALH
jgi:hypothetical protein